MKLGGRMLKRTCLILAASTLLGLSLSGCSPVSEPIIKETSIESGTDLGPLEPSEPENSDHGYLLEDNRIPAIATCEEWREFWVGSGPAISFEAAAVHNDPSIEVSTQIFLKNQILDSDGDGVICYLEFESEQTDRGLESWVDAPTLSISTDSELLPMPQCKVKQAEPLWFTRAGFPQSDEYKISDGKFVIQLLYVDASDLPASGLPSEDAEFWIEGAGEFLTAMTDDKIEFEWRYEDSYQRLDRPLADFRVTRSGRGDPRRFVQAAINASEAIVDYSDVDAVVAVLPPNVTSSLADYSPALPLEPTSPFRTDEGLVYRGTMTGSDTRWERGYLLLAHEIGHLLGLQDYYGYQYSEEDPFVDQFRFMGEFDNMNHAAGRALEWTGWSRWLLGTIDDSQVRCANIGKSSIHKLHAVADRSPEAKLLVIPTGRNTAIVAESRRSIRYDSALPAENQGALLYQVDTRRESGFGPLEIIRRGGLDDPMLIDAPLQPGEWVIVDGLLIEVVEAGELWDSIRVSPAQ